MRAALRADLTASPDGVPVEMTYRVAVPPGLEAVPLAALHIGDGSVVGLAATAAGRPAAVEWSRRAGGASAGRLVLPTGVGGGDSLVVRLTYRVDGARAGGDRVRIPVVRIPWRPRAAEPGTFVARAVLPDSLRVTETFPTVLGSVASRGGSRVYALDLHVVPSVVSLRVHDASASAVGLTRLVDVSVGLLLAVLALLGWRALRRESEAGAGEGPGTRREGAPG